MFGSRPASRLFRATILENGDYAGCTEVRPDVAMLLAVSEERGAIGQISFSFLGGAFGVRAVSVDGEQPGTLVIFEQLEAALEVRHVVVLEPNELGATQ